MMIQKGKQAIKYMQRWIDIREAMCHVQPGGLPVKNCNFLVDNANSVSIEDLWSQLGGTANADVPNPFADAGTLSPIYDYMYSNSNYYSWCKYTKSKTGKWNKG